MLNRKLLLDLVKSIWQYAAIAFMVLLGVTFFIASYAAYVNLVASYEASYRALAFEDFGIAFDAAPARTVERIQKLPGVKAAEGRLIENVTLELSRKQTKTLVGRLISMPIGRKPAVNQLMLLDGRVLTSERGKEVLLEASFAKYHKIEPGALVTAVRGTGRVKLKVVGIVQSDEYLYVVRSK